MAAIGAAAVATAAADRGERILVGYADDERGQQLTQLGHGGGRQLRGHLSRHGSTKEAEMNANNETQGRIE
jgi:hypothetical protein